MFRLQITLDNAAFGYPNCEAEIARILRETADDIESGSGDHDHLRDINGNTVGKYSITGV